MSVSKQVARKERVKFEQPWSSCDQAMISAISLDTRQSQKLGFTLRGGLEYGIGIYVSHIDLGSQADLKGLRRGDRILRINGHNLKYALQREALTLMLSRRDATLVVKHSGKLPYFDDETSQLVWKEVGDTHEDTPTPKGKGKRYHKLPDSGSKLSQRLINKADNDKTVEVVRAASLSGPIEGIQTRFGLLIESVTPGSLCSKLGISKGDEIVELNGITLMGKSVLQKSSMIAEMPVHTLRVRKFEGRELVITTNTNLDGTDQTHSKFMSNRQNSKSGTKL